MSLSSPSRSPLAPHRSYHIPAAMTHTHTHSKQDEEDVSPVVALHRAALLAKEAAVASATAAVSAVPASFVSSAAAAFPAMGAFVPSQVNGGAHQLVAAPVTLVAASRACASVSGPLSHPFARPTLLSPTAGRKCCLPRASFWNTRCSCMFSSLPDEILLFKVFPFLPLKELGAVSGVCARWKFLATDRMLWKDVDLSAHKSMNDQTFLGIMDRVGRDLGTLKLCNLKLLSHQALTTLAKEHFNENYSLRNVHFCSSKAMDYSILSTMLSGPSAHTLRELSLFGCVAVDDSCVRLIREKCAGLQDLSLRGCIKVTDQAFIMQSNHGEEEEAFDDSTEFRKGSTEMTIELLDSPFDPVVSSSRSLSSSSAISTGSPSSSSRSVSSSVAVLGSFAHLTTLNLANCKLLTAAGLISAFRASPKLRKLNLHGLNASDRVVDVLTSSCPDLKELHLSSANPFGGNLELTDQAVEHISARLPNITCLNLQGSSKLTDACLGTLVSRCQMMEKLNVGGCFKLTDVGVAALCQSEYTSLLTHVSLFQCVHLTDPAVVNIAHSLPSLQHLDISSCASLTDDSIMALIQRSTIDVYIPHHAPSPSLDDDEALAAFDAKLSPSSDSSAAFLLPSLQSLSIGSCRKITAAVVEQLKQMRPAVAVTHY